MPSNGNFFSEWAPVGGKRVHNTLLVVLVACAVGAAASATVTLSLIDTPMIRPGVPLTSPRVIVRNADASQTANSTKNRPTIETATGPAAISNLSDDQPAAKMEAKPQAQELSTPQSRKHDRSAARWRERDWGRRFTHGFSRQPRFSAW